MRIRTNKKSTQKPYIADFTARDGSRRQVACESFVEAEILVLKAIYQNRFNQSVRDSHSRRYDFLSRVSLEAFISWYCQLKYASSSDKMPPVGKTAERRLCRILKDQLPDRAVSCVSTSDIYAVRRHLEHRYSATTVYAYSCELERLFDLAKTMGCVQQDPTVAAFAEMPRKNKRRTIHFPTEGEMENLRAHASGLAKLCICLFYDLGLTMSEAHRLRWRDVQACFVRASNPKEAESIAVRHIPLSSTTQETLRSHRWQLMAVDDDFVLAHREGMPPHATATRRALEQLQLSIGMVVTKSFLEQNPTNARSYRREGQAMYLPTHLRDAAAVRWIKEGIDLKTVAARLGRTYVRGILRRYGAWVNEQDDSGSLHQFETLMQQISSKPSHRD